MATAASLISVLSAELLISEHSVGDMASHHYYCPRAKSRLVRAIGNHLSMKAPRVYLQKEMIGCEHRTKIEPGDQSDLEVLWKAPVPVTLADIKLLLRDTSDPGIRTRIQFFEHVFPGCLPSCDQSTKSDVRTPTGALSDASMVTPDLAAARRISELEAELQRLKQQLALIVVNQDSNVAALSLGASPALAGHFSPPVAPPPPPPPPPPGLPPPPPPPPPPPITSTPKSSVSDLIRQRRQQRGGSSSSTGKGGTPERPDMAKVLQGLGTVKLKSIKRSPGGTPMRHRPLPCDTDDPAALIARALKKKFAHRQNLMSPESEKENSSFERRFSSPSPKKSGFAQITPPGPHLLKKRKFKRRSQTKALSDVNA